MMKKVKKKKEKLIGTESYSMGQSMGYTILIPGGYTSWDPRKLQLKVGRPSTMDFIQVVTRNMLNNCSVTKANIIAAKDIFGTDLSGLKEKTTRQQTHAVKTMVVPIPWQSMSRYWIVTICTDVLFINRVPMLVKFPEIWNVGPLRQFPKDTSTPWSYLLVLTIRDISDTGTKYIT
jgi:hypothetical protein